MAKLNAKASVGCLVRHGDQLIMVYEEQDGRGAWDIPAGGIEAGESPEQAVLRELQEEIGLQTDSRPRLLRVFWAVLDVPTAHFLYELHITDAVFESLHPNTSDILDIGSFSRQDAQELLDTNAYEHKLAKARLELYLDAQKSGQPIVFTNI